MTWYLVKRRDNFTFTLPAAENLGYYSLKQHKPWFDEVCSKLLDQRKRLNCSDCIIHVKNGDNIKNVSHETIRNFREKRKDYLKGKISELEISSKKKNIRDFVQRHK